ncbi:type I-E CRISPR-associated endoribonuclease Cas2e [Armatimonas sp.]|uniref:type I-E CRISPR-associated endoribonuclease Cas2e n=1 Tax=Armatimonas sp. TaxID=1872638 RepID=UPI00374FFC7A
MSIPVAFEIAKQKPPNIERATRLRCRADCGHLRGKGAQWRGELPTRETLLPHKSTPCLLSLSGTPIPPMVVLILEKVPATLRGELSRWMIEPRTGVFVGQISAMVRDRLWELAVKGAKGGGITLLWSSPTEQGFQWRTFGDSKRLLIDFEGLTLVHIAQGPAEKRSQGAEAKQRQEQEALEAGD